MPKESNKKSKEQLEFEKEFKTLSEADEYDMIRLQNGETTIDKVAKNNKKKFSDK